MFRTLETFLVKAAENISNKIFCLGLVCQESLLAAKNSRLAANNSRLAAKKSRQAGRKCRQAWPGPHLKAAAKASGDLGNSVGALIHF